jgi:hypothetical protein
MKVYDFIPLEDKHILDVVSITATVGALLNMLPAVATLLSIVWIAIRIWETDTVQKHFGHSREDVDSIVAGALTKTGITEDAKHE